MTRYVQMYDRLVTAGYGRAAAYTAVVTAYALTADQARALRTAVDLH
jgi:hypothetical protein